VLASLLVRGFLGADFAGAEPVLRLGLLAAVPLAVFYAVRPTLDALQEHPVTTWLLLGSLVVEISLTYALGLVLSPALAAVLAFGLAAAVLGSASYLALTRAMAARAG
jgi:O-antigen/teichoic acid export membrane protein